MGSEAKYSVSKAGSSKGRLLASVFFLALIAHGLFFPAEAITFAFVILFLFGTELFRTNRRAELPDLTDFLLLGLSGLSLLGLLQPVKAAEAWLEALRYFLYWLIYRLGLTLAEGVPLAVWVRRAGWAALFLAVAGGVPVAYFWPTTGMSAAGRLNSLFGYANATGAFLAAVLLLPGLNPWLWPVLSLALLSTGSRSAVGLLILFKAVELWQGLSKPRAGNRRTLAKGIQISKNRKAWRSFAALLVGLLGTAALYLAGGAGFRSGWTHLFGAPVFDRSWGERLLYLQDGLTLAWRGKLLPQAGGWLAFPLVQKIPYWTLDAHSSVIRILVNQGLPGLLWLVLWAGLWGRRLWYRLRQESTGERLPELKAYVRVLVFLALHSLVDADFSFPVLGFFFWFLLGSLTGSLHLETMVFPGWKGRQRGRAWGMGPGRWLRPRILFGLAFSVALVLGLGFYRSNPPGGTVAVQAATAQETAAKWEGILHLDRTSVAARRELAAAAFGRGDWQAGLRLVEEILSWRKFDLSAYEWAQNLVWQAVEQGQISKQDVQVLCAWVEGVPARINFVAEQVPPKLRWLWAGYREFRATPHVELLARYARAHI